MKLMEEKILPVTTMESSVLSEMSEEETRELLRLNRKYLSRLREKVCQLFQEPQSGFQQNPYKISQGE